MIKKTVIFFIISFLFTIQGFTQEFKIQEISLVATFKAGKEAGELANDITAPLDTGPTAIAFDKQGKLYISDILNRRLIKYNQSFIFEKEFKNGNAWWALQLFITDNNELTTHGLKAFAVDDVEGNKKIFINLNDTAYNKEVISSPTFIYMDNYVFTYLKDESILIFENPGINTEKNIQKMNLKKEGAVDKVSDKIRMSIMESIPDTKSFTIEKDNRIIVDDKIKTQNFKDFTQYYGARHALKKNNLKADEQNKNLSVNEEKHYDGFTDEYLKKLVNTKFLGCDQEGNVYWRFTHNKIIIFNEAGYVKYALQYDNEKAKILPTIHPSGDIYFLGYDGQKNYLYKIARVW